MRDPFSPTPDQSMARHAPSTAATGQRPARRNLGVLLQLSAYPRTYGRTIAQALAALLVAAGAVLAFGLILQPVVDQGLASGRHQELLAHDGV